MHKRVQILILISILLFGFSTTSFAKTSDTTTAASETEQKNSDITPKTNVAAPQAIEPIPIQFEKAGGGQYIYCNNPEFIKEKDLSTTENPTPTYMMKNEGLKPDTYSVFYCFYNWTNFDVEPDIEFKTSGNASITINSVGYYMPDGSDDFWNCLGAWSDFMGINIRSLNNHQQFVPYSGATELPKTMNLASSSDWISKYIYNYDVVKPHTTFNMLVNFTINSGEADVNFAALKSYGKLGDRNHHDPNASQGQYYRDTAVKGIDTETLPMVKANLDVKIDSTVKNGDSVKVKIFNQYYNNGNVVPYWMTNINPNRDDYMFSKSVDVGSDMLNLTYKDDTKLMFYGENVPQSERDNIWRFDIYHHNTKGYENTMPWKEDDHKPNDYTSKTIDINKLPKTDWEFNLGNFGVTNRYYLTITNNDSVERTLNYVLDTTLASNIVIARDEQGNMLNPYTLDRKDPFAISKKINGAKEEACMFSAPIPAGQTKKYILDVILPTNCYGGMLNMLKVDDHKYLTEKPSTSYPEFTTLYQNKDVFYNGEANMKWEDGELYQSPDNVSWEHIDLPDSAKKIFASREKEFKIVKTSEGYAARFAGWDDIVTNVMDNESQNKVYFFDANFNYKKFIEFPAYISDMVYYNKILYVSSDKNYASKDGKVFVPLGKEYTFPVTNGKNTIVTKSKELYMKNKDDSNTKISFEATAPKEIFGAGGLFYCKKSWKSDFTDTATKNILSVSADGVYWTDFSLPDKYYEIMNVSYLDNKIYVDCKNEVFSFDYQKSNENIIVNLNNNILAFKEPAKVVNDRTMVPLRFLFEKLLANVSWNDATQEITVKKDANQIVLKIDSTTAYINGEEKTVDVPPYLDNDKTMIPIRFLTENLGYKVNWDGENNMVVISAENGNYN